MKIIAILLSSATGLLVFSTLLCGLWLRAKGVTPEGVNFHVSLALVTVAAVVITVIAQLIFVLRS